MIIINKRRLFKNRMNSYICSMLEDKNEKPVNELEELGEFGLIKHLTEKIKLQNTSSLKGVGECCSD